MRTKGAAFSRFLVVGGMTAIVSAAAMFALVDGLGFDAIAAAAIVAVAGNIWGFVANRQWSFQATDGPAVVQCIRYMAVSLAAIGISVGLFVLLTEIGMHYFLASLSVSALFAIANFLAHFYWSFASEQAGRRSV